MTYQPPLQSEDVGYRPGPIEGIPEEVRACFPERGLLHEYVWFGHHAMFSPPIWHVGAFLATFAWELANAGWSVTGRGRKIGLPVWLVGDASLGKSSALRRVREVHHEVLLRREIDWTPEKSPWIQAEGTIPGLLETIHDHERLDPLIGSLTPAILFHEEASSLLAGGGQTIDTLMQLFDGVDIRRSLRSYRAARKQGQRTPDVTNPAISAVLGATHSSLERVMQSTHFEGGLASRSLWLTGSLDFAHWESRRFDREAPEVRSRRRAWIIERWMHLARSLEGHRVLAASRSTQSGAPSVAELTPEVEDILRIELGGAFRRAYASGDKRIAAAYNRGVDLARLIAELFALSKGWVEVDEEDMHAAIALVKLSTRTLEELADVVSDDEGFKLTMRLERLIQEAGREGINRSALQRVVQRTKRDLDAAFADLEERGTICSMKVRSAGGRPALRYFAARYAPKQVLDFEAAISLDRDDDESDPDPTIQ